ncbi:MAG: DnaJ domain-containing protein [Pseudomonadota bacterium]|jgi:molecular chaperone DnaJ
MNFYEILDLKQNATQEEIKAAFRKKAMEHHPDRNPNNKESEEKFKQVNAAYEVLGNPQKRLKYDRQQSRSHEPFPQGFPFPSSDEMFASLFGNFTTIRHANIPRHQTNINLTLTETLQQQEKTVVITLKSKCSKCLGTAVGKHERCNTCKGSGCNVCGGLGVCYTPCDLCKGAGFFTEPKEVKITIPKGLFSNTQLNVNTSYGGLLVNITVDYPQNIKLGANGRLIMQIPIPYHIAILGGIHQVETIEGGTVNVKFPQLSKNDQLIKIKGKGLYFGPNSTERGDLFLSPFIEIPENITDEYKTIIEQLANLYNRKEQTNE